MKCIEEHSNNSKDGLVERFVAELEAAKSRLSSTSTQAVTAPSSPHLPTNTTSTSTTTPSPHHHTTDTTPTITTTPSPQCPHHHTTDTTPTSITTPSPHHHTTDTTSTSVTINDDSVKTTAAVVFNDDSSTSPAQKPSFGHRAGFDAFMTGYIFAYYAAVTTPNKHSLSISIDTMIAGLSSMRNRLSNRNKPVPLILAKSQFEKTSQIHRDNCLKIAEFKNLSMKIYQNL